jgi:hypothetical protein
MVVTNRVSSRREETQSDLCTARGTYHVDPYLNSTPVGLLAS